VCLSCYDTSPAKFVRLVAWSPPQLVRRLQDKHRSLDAQLRRMNVEYDDPCHNFDRSKVCWNLCLWVGQWVDGYVFMWGGRGFSKLVGRRTN
jgi:hypothetical protein